MAHWTEETFVEHPEVFEVSMRQRVDAADQEVEDLLALVGDYGIDPEAVLDVACGIGRHARALAAAEIAVYGIDISPDYVEAARELAAQAGVTDRATFEVGDMRNLAAVGGEYEVVTNLWTSFGYFDDATNEAVAEGFRECVADGGALVMELANRDARLANYHDSSASLEGGILYVERREYAPETGRIEATLTLFRERDIGYESVGEVAWNRRAYAPAELRRLLERAGFSTVDLYGGLGGAKLEQDSNRLVVVAEP